MLYRTRVIR